MSCQKVLSLLSAFSDGEVQNSDAETIKTHLSECDSCAAEWKALQAMTGMLRTTPEVEPPAFLLAQIEAATVNRTGFLARIKRAFDYVPTTARWASAPVAAIVLLGILLSNNGPVPVNNPTQQVEKAPGMPNAIVEEQTPAPSNVVASRPKARSAGWRTHGGKAIAGAKDVNDAKKSPSGEKELSNADQPVPVEEPKLEEPVVNGTVIADNTSPEPERDLAPTPVSPSEQAKTDRATQEKPVKKTVALEEPGVMEQLRAKLAAKNKSKLNNHEGIEGRKYSVGLISLRF